MNRFLNSWWCTYLICALALAIIIFIAIDITAMVMTGRSIWFPYPK